MLFGSPQRPLAEVRTDDDVQISQAGLSWACHERAQFAASVVLLRRIACSRLSMPV